MVEHVDEEVLASAALGEPLDDASRAHLGTCPACGAELTALARILTTGRSLTADDVLVDPPTEVWDRIRDELGIAEGRPEEQADHAAAGLGRVGPDGAPSAAAARDRRTRRWTSPWLAGAAAAGVVVGGAGGALVAGGSGPGTTPAPAESEVVARAALDPLPGRDTEGAATVEQGPDGTRVLVLSLADEGAPDSFREVWLIDREVTRLISLGVLEGGQGRFTVPAGVDLSDFAVVDVSEEPIDGDPAHSGDSVVRGILQT